MQGYPEDENKREYLSGLEIAGDFEPAIFRVWKGRAEAPVSIVHLVRAARCMRLVCGNGERKPPSPLYTWSGQTDVCSRWICIRPAHTSVARHVYNRRRRLPHARAGYGKMEDKRRGCGLTAQLAKPQSKGIMNEYRKSARIL